MSDLDSTSVSPSYASPAEIAATGDIPTTWSVEIRKRAVSMARRATVATKALADDLERLGRTALWRAARAFDPRVGIPFEHYARRAIRHAMISELRFVEHATAAASATSIDDDPGTDVIPRARDEDQPDEQCMLKERRELVRDWIRVCPARLRQVYEFIYVNGLTQREAAELMQISQPRVSRYHRHLLEVGREDLAHVLAA